MLCFLSIFDIDNKNVVFHKHSYIHLDLIVVDACCHPLKVHPLKVSWFCALIIFRFIDVNIEKIPHTLLSSKFLHKKKMIIRATGIEPVAI